MIVPSAAADGTFTGSVSATGTSWRFYRIAVAEESTLTARLDWVNTSARLALTLSRRNADGTWTWVAGARGRPATLTRVVQPGVWRLGVRALSGTTPFTLSETSTPVEPPGPAPPFVTILFSRSAMAIADACVENPLGAVRTDLVVAPELQRRGYTATGTVQTGATRETVRACLHGRQSLTASWADMAMLRDVYGWSFVSHSRNYRLDLPALTPERQRAETCGSIADLRAHGHRRGDGLFAYPNNIRTYTPQLQETVVSTCFAFGRLYADGFVTERALATAPPYVQNTWSVSGGRCNDPALPCSSLVTHVDYSSPDDLAALAATVGTDRWLTMQWYMLVEGAREGHWDCTSPDWRAHWAMDAERYCYVDFLKVLDAIPAHAVVTDPLTVAQAWGRTNYVR